MWGCQRTELDALLRLVPLLPRAAGLLRASVGGDVDDAVHMQQLKGVVREREQLIVRQVPVHVRQQHAWVMHCMQAVCGGAKPQPIHTRTDHAGRPSTETG